MKEGREIEEAVKEVVKIGLRFEQQGKLAEATAVADRERKRKLLKQEKESRSSSGS